MREEKGINRAVMDFKKENPPSIYGLTCKENVEKRVKDLLK
jgi:hypothetical protein